MDEMFIRVNGRVHYLWRAVDQEGEVLYILVQSRRDKWAAKRFFRKLLKGFAVRAAGDRHEPTRKLSSSQAGDPARCRAPPAEEIEQPRGELPSTAQSTRACEETFQVGRTCESGFSRPSGSSRRTSDPADIC